MRGIFNSLFSAINWILILLAIFIPLGIWKIVEIIKYLYERIDISFGFN